MSDQNQGPVWDAERQRWAYDTTIGRPLPPPPAQAPVPPPPAPAAVPVPPPAPGFPPPAAVPQPYPELGPPPGPPPGGGDRRSRMIVAAVVTVALIGGGVTALVATGKGPSWLGGSSGHKPSASGPPSTTRATSPTTSPAASTPGGTPSAPPTTTAPTTPPTTAPTSPALTPTTGPAGYQLLNDPAGFTLRVPDGWQRTTDKSQIFYSPDSLDHLLQIGVNATDGTTPLAAMQAIDAGLSGRPDYHRVSLRATPTATGDAATLEYTYTNADFGSRHAIDRDFYSADGKTLYFLLAAGPADEWPDTLSKFTVAAASFCRTGECPTQG